MSKADASKADASKADASKADAFPKAAEFRQYAEEAFRGAAASESDDEKQTLIKLARTWSQAARRADAILAPHPLSPDQGPIPQDQRKGSA
jgi:hypothetical protein